MHSILSIQLFIVMAAMLKRTYGLRNLITKLLTKGIVGLLYLYLCNRALVQPIIFRVRGFYSVQYGIKPVFLFPLLLTKPAYNLEQRDYEIYEIGTYGHFYFTLGNYVFLSKKNSIIQ